MGQAADLPRRVAQILRDHDPLEPWLTESHWDEDHWLGEATEIVARLRDAVDPVAARQLVVAVVTEKLSLDLEDAAVASRFDAIGRAVWELHQTTP